MFVPDKYNVKQDMAEHARHIKQAGYYKKFKPYCGIFILLVYAESLTQLPDFLHAVRKIYNRN